MPLRFPALRHRPRHFSVRPWRDAFGPADRPAQLLGSPVTTTIGVRDDRSAALVRLEDGRYALTGAVLAAGSRRDLRRYATRRAAQSTDAVERRWLDACAALLTHDHDAGSPPDGRVVAG